MLPLQVLGETQTETARPGQVKTVTICMNYFTTGDPGKGHGTNKPPPTRRIRERSKGERRRQCTCPTSLPESSSLESILAEWLHAPPGRTLSQNGWPETTRKLIPSP